MHNPPNFKDIDQIIFVELTFKDIKKNKKYRYSDVEKDEGGWADVNRWIPASYDICALKIEGKQKSYKGWYTGKGWDGLRLEGDEKVLYWKNITKEVDHG